jgi:hypothetical protein
MFAAGSPLLAGHRKKAKCIEHNFINPLKQHKYIKELDHDFSAANADAFLAAETSFGDSFGTELLAPPTTPTLVTAHSAAANNAAVAFFATGGDVYHASDAVWLLKRVQSLINLDGDGSGDGSASASGATATAFAASVAAVIQSALASSSKSGSNELATTFIETFTGLTATEGDKTAIKTLLADETAYVADKSVVAVAASASSDSFASDLLSASATVALLVPNILLPRASLIGTTVKSVTILAANYASQKEWTCTDDRTGELETAMQLLMAMGYYWRPTYGKHWSFNDNKEEVFSTERGINAASKIYFRYDQEWSPAECLIRNDDVEKMLGEVVEACMMPWAPSLGMPIGLVLGDIKWNLTAAEANAFYNAELALGNKTSEEAKAKMMSEKAASGVTSIGAHRLVMSDFAPTHWLHKARMKKRLNAVEELTEDEMVKIHYDMQDEYRIHLERFWAKQVGSGFEPGGVFDGLKFSFAVGRSISDLITDGTDLQVAPIIAVYVIMLLYVGGSLLGWKSNVRSHFWVGIAGVFIIGCAVISSLGLAAWFGVLFTPLVTNVAPFVALGIGVDDMLVFAHEYAALLRQDAARSGDQKRYKNSDDVPLLITHVLEIAGPSCCFTTTTNFIAFMVATVCPIAVVQLLAQVLAVNVVTNFLFLVLFFVPVIYFDARRVLGSTANELCCIGAACCTGTDDQGEDEEEQSWSKVISKFLRTKYGPWITGTKMKAVIIVVFLVFFSIQIGFLVSPMTKLGLQSKDVTIEGTYQYDLYSQLDEKFQFFNQYLIQTSDNFASASSQLGFQMAARNFALPDLVEKSVMAQGTGESWMSMVNGYKPQKDCTGADNITVITTATQDSFQKLDMCNIVDPESTETYMNTTYTITQETDFYYAFGTFLNGLGGLMAGNFVCKNTVSQEITSCFDIVSAYPTDGTPVGEQSRDVVLVASYEMVILRDIADTPDHVDAIRDTRRYVDNCQAKGANGEIAALIGPDEATVEGFWTYPTGATYRFFAQYLYTKRDLIRTVLFAAAGVFAATSLFMMSWRSSLILCLVIAMTVIELAGLIPESSASLVNGLRLNAFSIVNLTICVGMTIEFTAHIVHCFITTPGENTPEGRDQRVVEALSTMGPAVIHGGVTSLIASAVLAMSGQPFIVSYYFFMHGALTLCCEFCKFAAAGKSCHVLLFYLMHGFNIPNDVLTDDIGAPLIRTQECYWYEDSMRVI